MGERAGAVFGVWRGKGGRRAGGELSRGDGRDLVAGSGHRGAGLATRLNPVFRGIAGAALRTGHGGGLSLALRRSVGAGVDRRGGCIRRRCGGRVARIAGLGERAGAVFGVLRWKGGRRAGGELPPGDSHGLVAGSGRRGAGRRGAVFGVWRGKGGRAGGELSRGDGRDLVAVSGRRGAGRRGAGLAARWNFVFRSVAGAILRFFCGTGLCLLPGPFLQSLHYLFGDLFRERYGFFD